MFMVVSYKRIKPEVKQGQIDFLGIEMCIYYAAQKMAQN